MRDQRRRAQTVALSFNPCDVCVPFGRFRAGKCDLNLFKVNIQIDLDLRAVDWNYGRGRIDRTRMRGIYGGCGAQQNRSEMCRLPRDWTDGTARTRELWLISTQFHFFSLAFSMHQIFAVLCKFPIFFMGIGY